jgi:beta-galactosidase/beta-glucuronidase
MSTDSLENYPRPDFYRTDLHWTSLDGPWDFLFDDEDTGLTSQWHQKGLPIKVTVQNFDIPQQPSHSEHDEITAKITGNTQKLSEGNLAHRKATSTVNHRRTIIVPYVFQSPASGINERAVHEVLWYERRIPDIRSASEKSKGYRLIVRFGAVDYEAKVWVNGNLCGGHRGGHVPFDMDITDAVEAGNQKENRLTLRVYDSAYDLTQPRGKQYWGAKPESIFYTPSSGIWQSVWLESVPPARIATSSQGTVFRSDDISTGILHARVAILGRRAGARYSVQIQADYEGNPVNTPERKLLPQETDHVEIDISMRLTNEGQRFAESMRSHLPGKETSDWQNGVAVWSPDNPQLYTLFVRLFDSAGDMVDEVRTDIGMRSLSWENNTFKLNGKPIFQSLCLDQGYWPESFMTPPSSKALREDIEMAKRVGFNGCRKHQKVEDPRFLYWADRLGYVVWGEMANAYKFSEEYVERFNAEWTEAVKRDINHPCIVTWTPVNESWAYTDLKGSVQQRTIFAPCTT